MEKLIKIWDGESVLVRYDRPCDAWTFVAVHSTRLGPAIGGTRLKTYPDLAAALLDAQRLAEGMTYKWAAAGIQAGGGKAVIAAPEHLYEDDRCGLLRRHGALVHSLRGLFITGPDLGTASEDMDIVAEAAPEYVLGRTEAAGGGGNPAPFTAAGVFTAMEVACKQLFGEASLSGRRVVIQGVGHVGEQLAPRLIEAGAEVAFTDVNESRIAHFRKMDMEFVSPETIYDTPCDIFAPCAVGGGINAETIERLRCKAVVGGANNQLGEPEDAARLAARGILYAPDFVANCGGAVGLIELETRGNTHEGAMQVVVDTVRSNLPKIFDLAAEQGISTGQAARRLAERRLSVEQPS